MDAIATLRIALGLDSAAFNTGLDRSKKKAEGFATGIVRSLAPVGAALAAAFSSVALGKLADEWSDMNARLRNVTGSVEAGAAAMSRLEAVARRTYSPISQTTDAFLRQASTLNALGVSAEKQLDHVEALNSSLVISATRGDRARSVMDAWAKAMATGKLSGDDLNAVITGSDRLAKALADSMGINVTELRKYGEQGKITQAAMLGVTSQLGKLREEADAMPATIADGMGQMGNAMLSLVGRVDQAIGASGTFGSTLVAIADAIGQATPNLVSFATALGDVLAANLGKVTAAAVAFGAYLGAQFVAQVTIAATTTGALSAAFAVLRTALARTGIGALVIIAGDIAFKIAEATGATQALADGIIWLMEPLRRFFDFLKNGVQASIASFNWMTDGMANALTLGLNEDLGKAAEQSGINAARLWAHAFGESVPELVDIDAVFASLGGAKTFGSVKEMFASMGGGGGGISSRVGAITDQMKSALEALRLSLMTEEQAEIASHEKRLAEIARFYQAGMILRAEHDAMIELATAQHAERMNVIAQKQVDEEGRIREQLVGNVSSIFGSISQLLEGLGEKNLGIAKAFGVAEAVVNTAQGVTKALAQGGMLGFAGAAAVAAAGAAQIATILSASKGGSSRPTVGAGSSGISAGTAPAMSSSPEKIMNITLQGEGNISRDQFRKFVEAAREFGGDGMRLNFVET